MNPTNYINTHNTTFIIFLITSKTHIHTHNGTPLHVHRQGIQSPEEMVKMGLDHTKTSMESLTQTQHPEACGG